MTQIKEFSKKIIFLFRLNSGLRQQITLDLIFGCIILLSSPIIENKWENMIR